MIHLYHSHNLAVSLIVLLITGFFTFPLFSQETIGEYYVICNETGEPVPAYRSEMYRDFETSPPRQGTLDNGDWISVGPPGGDIRSLTTDPSDNSIVIAGAGFSMATDAGGLFKSTDGGITWQATGLEGKPVYGVAVSPSEDGVYWAAAFPGLYKSTDYGETWNVISYAGTSLLEVGVKEDDGDVIVVALSGNNGIRLTTDGGDTFQSVGVDGGFVREIKTTPAAPDNFYIVGRSLPGDHSGFVSTDGGQTWDPIGLTGNAESIWIDPEDEDVIFIVHNTGIHKTTDGGEEWDLVHAVSASFSDGGIVKFGGNMFASINGHGMFESTDDGETWTQNNQGIVRTIYQGNATASSAGGLFAFNGGIHRSDDVGSTYTLSIDGLYASFVHTLAFYRDRNELWAGTDGTGLFVSTDEGETWEHRSNGLMTSASWVISELAPGNHDYYNVDRMLVATSDGVYVSDDFGNSWYHIGPPGVTPVGVEIHPNDEDIFWVAANVGGVVHTTTDGGDNWSTSQGLPGMGLFPRLAVGEDPDTDIRLFISFQQNAASVYYSDDLGATFTGSEPLTGTQYHPRLSIRPSNDELPHMVYVATDAGIFKSEDYGETYISTAPSGGFAWGVLGDRGTYVFMAGSNGVWVSTDEGDNWEPLNEGLVSTMWTVIYGSNDDELFAGSRGMGGYKLAYVTDVKPPPGIPVQYSLLQNFPNPFNPNTTIRYALPERSTVKLEIYNTLGQRVVTLVNTELEAGYHDTEWFSGRAASGVYFYRIEAVSTDNPSNRFVEVRSMILLK